MKLAYFFIVLLALTAVNAKKDKTTRLAVQDVDVVSTTATTAMIIWSPTADDEGLTGYRIILEVEMGDSSLGDDIIVDVPNPTATQYTVSGLIPSTYYTVVVRAVYGDKTGAKSAPIDAQTLPLAPTAITVVEAARDVATISWKGANTHGNLPTLRFVLSIIKADQSEDPTLINIDGRTTLKDLTGLTPSTTYVVSVATGNAAGLSQFSQAVTFTTSPTERSRVVCAADNIRHGASILCSVLPRDMNGHISEDDEVEDFTIAALHGRISNINRIGEQISFEYTAPLVGSVDSIDVTLTNSPGATIEGSPVNIKLAARPSIASRLECKSDLATVRLFLTIPCTIHAIDADGLPAAAVASDFYVTAKHGGISALITEDGYIFKFDYQAPAMGDKDVITAVLSDSGAAIVNSPLAFNLFGVPTEQSELTCLKLAVAGRKSRCTIKAIDKDGNHIMAPAIDFVLSSKYGKFSHFGLAVDGISLVFKYEAPANDEASYDLVDVVTAQLVSTGNAIVGSGRDLIIAHWPTTATTAVCDHDQLSIKTRMTCHIFPHDGVGAIAAPVRINKIKTFAASAMLGRVTSIKASADYESYMFTYSAPTTKLHHNKVDEITVTLNYLDGTPVSSSPIKVKIVPQSAKKLSHKEIREIEEELM